MIDTEEVEDWLDESGRLDNKYGFMIDDEFIIPNSMLEVNQAALINDYYELLANKKQFEREAQQDAKHQKLEKERA